MCRPKWPFLHIYGSHDMRHVDFRGLTGSQQTPRDLGRHNLCEYENSIKETYEEYFDSETIVKTEIVKYYIDNLYVSSSSS